MLPDSVRGHQCLRSESHYVRLPCLFSALESVLPVRERAETDGDEVLVNSYSFIGEITEPMPGRRPFVLPLFYCWPLPWPVFHH